MTVDAEGMHYQGRRRQYSKRVYNSGNDGKDTKKNQ